MKYSNTVHNANHQLFWPGWTSLSPPQAHQYSNSKPNEGQKGKDKDNNAILMIKRWVSHDTPVFGGSAGWLRYMDYCREFAQKCRPVAGTRGTSLGHPGSEG